MRDHGAMVMLDPDKSRQISPDGVVARQTTAVERDELLLAQIKGWKDSFIEKPTTGVLLIVIGGAGFALFTGPLMGLLATCGLSVSTSTLIGGKLLTLGIAYGGGVMTIDGIQNARRRFSRKK